MTAPNTYPREWFCVSDFDGAIVAREFVRETDKFLVWRGAYGGERREAKTSQYDAWYPTREAAEAASAAIKQNRDEQKALRLKRNAAPELYEALAKLAAFHESGGHVGNADEAIAAASAALAKARGEAA